jgi:hypothetical protein
MRIRVARTLMSRVSWVAGDAGPTKRELVSRTPETEGRSDILATGYDGKVDLSYPILVPAAQPRRATRPRFMARRPRLPRQSLSWMWRWGPFARRMAIRWRLHDE